MNGPGIYWIAYYPYFSKWEIVANPIHRGELNRVVRQIYSDTVGDYYHVYIDSTGNIAAYLRGAGMIREAIIEIGDKLINHSKVYSDDDIKNVIEDYRFQYYLSSIWWECCPTCKVKPHEGMLVSVKVYDWDKYPVHRDIKFKIYLLCDECEQDFFKEIYIFDAVIREITRWRINAKNNNDL